MCPGDGPRIACDPQLLARRWHCPQVTREREQRGWSPADARHRGPLCAASAPLGVPGAQQLLPRSGRRGWRRQEAGGPGGGGQAAATQVQRWGSGHAVPVLPPPPLQPRNSLPARDLPPELTGRLGGRWGRAGASAGRRLPGGQGRVSGAAQAGSRGPALPPGQRMCRQKARPRLGPPPTDCLWGLPVIERVLAQGGAGPCGLEPLES